MGRPRAGASGAGGRHAHRGGRAPRSYPRARGRLARPPARLPPAGDPAELPARLPRGADAGRGIRTWMLDPTATGRFRTVGRASGTMERWFFSARRHVPRRLLETMRRECSVSCSRTCSPRAPSVPRRRRGGWGSRWSRTSRAGTTRSARASISPHCAATSCRTASCEDDLVATTGSSPTESSSPAGRRPTSSIEAPARGLRGVVRGYGLDPGAPVVLVMGNTPTNAPYEARFVERLVGLVGAERAAERFSLLFRPHPRDREWRERFAPACHGKGQPCRSRATPTSRRSRRCSSTATWSSANAGTILLDALVNDRPAVCVLYDEGAPAGRELGGEERQRRALQGARGLGRVLPCRSFEEVVAGIERALEQPGELAAERRRVVARSRRRDRRPRSRAGRRRDPRGGRPLAMRQSSSGCRCLRRGSTTRWDLRTRADANSSSTYSERTHTLAEWSPGSGNVLVDGSGGSPPQGPATAKQNRGKLPPAAPLEGSYALAEGRQVPHQAPLSAPNRGRP